MDRIYRIKVSKDSGETWEHVQNSETCYSEVEADKVVAEFTESFVAPDGCEYRAFEYAPISPTQRTIAVVNCELDAARLAQFDALNKYQRKVSDSCDLANELKRLQDQQCRVANKGEI